MPRQVLGQAVFKKFFQIAYFIHENILNMYFLSFNQAQK